MSVNLCLVGKRQAHELHRDIFWRLISKMPAPAFDALLAAKRLEDRKI
jgi:hypothetical protein